MSKEPQNQEVNWEEAKPNWKKWLTIGDTLEGVYVEKSIRPDSLAQVPTNQEVYVIVDAAGEPWFVSGRTSRPSNTPGAVPTKVLLGMDRMALGQKVRMVYADEVATKKGTGFKAKIIKVYGATKADGKPLLQMDVLNHYHGNAVGMEIDADGFPVDVKTEDIPV